MRHTLAALALIVSGCSLPSNGPQVGSTYIVSPKDGHGYEGDVLAVDSSRDGQSSGILPVFIPPFRGVFLDTLPIVNDAAIGLDREPRWKLRIEDGPHAGRVVGVYQHMAELTPVK